MPEDLDPDARGIWRRIMRDMAGSGVILACDSDMLRLYCETMAAYRRDAPLLRTSGALIRGARGRELVRNPLGQIVREHKEMARLLGRELGLSPAARAGLRVEMGGAALDMDEVIGVHPRLKVVNGDD